MSTPDRVMRWSFLLAMAMPLPVAIVSAQPPHPGERRVRRDSTDEEDSIFFENAFNEALVGERPPFLQGAAAAAAAASATSERRPSESAGRWSRVISAATLEDEIKAQQQVLLTGLRSPRLYLSEHAESVADAYSLLASLFGIVESFDGEIRWSHQAALARARFAQLARQLQQADRSTYPQAVAGLQELQELLGGGDLPPAAAVPLHWPDVADRMVLMRRLEGAVDQRLPSEIPDAEKSTIQSDAVRHEAEVIAALAAMLLQDEMPEGRDEEYRECAQLLRVQATELASQATHGDLAQAPRSLTAIEATCTRCHDSFR